MIEVDLYHDDKEFIVIDRHKKLRQENEKLKKKIKTLERKVRYRSAQLADIRNSNQELRDKLYKKNNAT